MSLAQWHQRESIPLSGRGSGGTHLSVFSKWTGEHPKIIDRRLAALNWGDYEIDASTSSVTEVR